MPTNQENNRKSDTAEIDNEKVIQPMKPVKPSVKKEPFKQTYTMRDFGIIAKNFHDEPLEVQNDLIAASGLLQLIKINLNEEVAIIKYLVRKSYAQFSDIEKYVPGDHLAEAIAITDTIHWNTFWDGLYKSIAMQTVPGITWEKVSIYHQYIYQVLVKTRH